MMLEGRSRKSQEAHADMLLKIAQSIYIAIFLGLIAAPINIIFGSYLGSSEKVKPLGEIINDFWGWGFFGIAVLAIVAWILAYYFEREALNVLDKYCQQDKKAEFKEKISKR